MGTDEFLELFADLPPDDHLAQLLALHQVVTAHMRENPPLAARAAAASWAIAERFPDNPLLRAQAYWSRGTAILYLPDYAGALAAYDAALVCYEQARAEWAPASPPLDVRVVEVVRVFCLNELGRYQEALAAAEAAERWLREHPTPGAQLILLLNRSLLAGNMGDYREMYALAEATVAAAETLDRVEARAMGLINRAYAAMYLGDLDQAESDLALGIADAEATGESLTVARGMVNRAWLLRCQGKLAEALRTLRAAEPGLAQAPGEAATLALVAATIAAQLCQYAEAQGLAQRAAEEFAAQGLPLYSADAALWAARAAIAHRDRSAAQRHLAFASAQARALSLVSLDAQIVVLQARAVLLPTSAGSARTGGRAMLKAVTAAGERLAAAGMQSEALEAELAAAGLAAQLGQSQRAQGAYLRLAASQSASVQLEAHAALGGLLPAVRALPHREHAAALATAGRRALPAEELQARYSSATSEHHLQLAACRLDLGDLSGALEAIWEAKAGPLLDLRAAASLDQVEQRRLDGVRAALARARERERDQRRRAEEAMQLGQQARAEQHLAAVAAAQRETATCEREVVAIAQSLVDRDGRAQVPSLEGVRGALGHDTALLEYARLGDQIFCFTVRGDGAAIRCHALSHAAEIRRLCQKWEVVRSTQRAERYPAEAIRRQTQVLPMLYEQLVAPLRDELHGVTRLLIAPFEALHHLPWAAMLDGGETLAERYTLTLTPSGALWAATPPAGQPQGAPLLLGYAGEGDTYLPGVAPELAAVAAALSDARVIVPASSADLRVARAPRLLHIAAHAVTRPDAPICSWIELADGPFLLLEAHRLDLRGTALVCLSACETGARPDYGEMALAIAGAFLCAGARMALASLWAVDDRAAEALMGRLYAALAGGSSPAEALRTAQLATRDAFPRDWAAFQVWGGAPDGKDQPDG